MVANERSVTAATRNLLPKCIGDTVTRSAGRGPLMARRLAAPVCGKRTLSVFTVTEVEWSAVAPATSDGRAATHRIGVYDAIAAIAGIRFVDPSLRLWPVIGRQTPG